MKIIDNHFERKLLPFFFSVKRQSHYDSKKSYFDGTQLLILLYPSPKNWILLIRNELFLVAICLTWVQRFAAAKSLWSCKLCSFNSDNDCIWFCGDLAYGDWMLQEDFDWYKFIAVNSLQMYLSTSTPFVSSDGNWLDFILLQLMR